MLTTVEGVFKDGKVELSEVPPGVDESRVIVTFLDKESRKTTAKKGTMIYRGMFAGKIETTEEDFNLAEWRGEDDEI